MFAFWEMDRMLDAKKDSSMIEYVIPAYVPKAIVVYTQERRQWQSERPNGQQ